MEYQLRIYKVKDGLMEKFLGIFPAVVEARQAVGFEVTGAWMIPEENQFIWIVGAEDGIEATSERYYASEQRRAIEPEPAKLLETIDTRTLVIVPT
ncbi:MAG: NIPSNAP family containing protein [Acidimicrobiia bacterium]